MKKKCIEDMRRIASKKGGKCLSDIYVDCKSHLRWQCRKGHEWNARPDNIVQGKWCPKCAIISRNNKNTKHGIKEAQNIAILRNGTCLSEHSYGLKGKLKWKCQNGHVWESSLHSVVYSKSWCPYCSKYLTENKCRYIIEQFTGCVFNKNRKCLDNKYELDGYCEHLKLGFEYNGEQHYRFIKRFHRDLDGFVAQKQRDFDKKKLCESLNIQVIPYWTANKDDRLVKYIHNKLINFNIPIIRDSLNLTRFYKRNMQLEILRRLAAGRGGKILSSEYHGSTSKIKCKCHAGHEWDTAASNIKSGRWCPKCAGNLKYTIEDMQEIAHSKGGECLSQTYINIHKHLRWRCNQGHEWETSPVVIVHGKPGWCPTCYKHRHTLDDMHQLAKNKKGKCLSSSYADCRTKLRWQCENGHVWKAMPRKIKEGQWCPKCRYL